MSVCSVGCIGCKMCEKVFVNSTLLKWLIIWAHIDPAKCTNCENVQRNVEKDHLINFHTKKSYEKRKLKLIGYRVKKDIG